MNKKILIGIVIGVLLLGVIGFSYSFFTTSIIGTGQENTVTAGTLELQYIDGPGVSLSKAYPGQSITKVVSVKNIGTLDAEYDLIFKDLINEIEKDELVISYTCISYKDYVDSNNKGTVSGTCNNLTNQVVPYSVNATDSIISTNITIAKDITHEYTFTITFKEISDNQNYNQGKHFSAKINAKSTISNVNVWENKTAVFVGDSITYGEGTTNKYWEYLDESLNLSTVTGMGISGSTISVKSDYGTQNTPLINRYTTIPDADLISIFMGTNDYGHETPLGTIEDTTDVSFYGALNVIVPALKEAHPNSRIVFVTPIHRYGFGTSKILGTAFTYDNLPNGVGANLEDYVNAIKEVCSKNDIPVIDLFTLFKLDVTDASIRSEYIPDGLHPNAKGHQVIADLIASELRKIAPINNINDDNDQTVENDITMQLGNAFDPSYINDVTRASASKNIYLKAGTLISLKNSTTYNYGVSNQTSESVVANLDFLSTWTTNTITIQKDGWYGITVKRVDNANIDLGGTDPNVITGYINIVEPVEIETDLNKTMILGNKFDSAYASALNRATANENIYLKAGTVISLKDSSTYNYGLISQTDETLVASSSPAFLTGGWTANSYTITSDGYYGITVKRVDNANIDLGGTDPNVITGYINFN
ncbi:MAG: hypothetical protein IJB83_00445 [Bacilli bacterium]|nr:hypothetical protein [Bacilli bacterium]